MTRYLTLALLALGCSAADPGTDATEPQPGPVTGGTSQSDPLPMGGLGGRGGAPPDPDPEPEEPSPEPWMPDPRPEPPGRPGFGDPCQRPSDCEIPGVTGDSLVCHAGRCGFLCDRWQGLEVVASEYLERLCASTYGSVCRYGAAHPERDACVR